MKILITLLNSLILVILIASPIFIMKVIRKRNFKYSFITYLISVMFITAFLLLFFAWWSDFSNQMLLKSYGYNFNAMNEYEEYKNVAAENLSDTKKLRISMMGIGWPLKAIMTYIFYIPYLILVYVLHYFFMKPKIENHKNLA